MADYKLDIFKMLEAVDCKDYDFYDRITDEERKGFSPFTAIKWTSVVEGDQNLQHWYLAATNHYCNKHWFDLGSEHRKLQWLELCAVSPGIGKQRHGYLKQKSKEKKSEHKKQLMELFPTMKEEDVEVLSSLVTKREVDEYIKQHGN
jgi:hypothetical protein